jgi:hypothetical protein
MVLQPLLRGLALRFVFFRRPRFNLSHAGETFQTTRAIALLLTLSGAVAFLACTRAAEERISGTTREGSLQCDEAGTFVLSLKRLGLFVFGRRTPQCLIPFETFLVTHPRSRRVVPTMTLDNEILRRAG